MTTTTKRKPAAKGRATTVSDSLANAITGSQGPSDRKSGRTWVERVSNEFMVETAYRGSWLMRKIVNIPAQDAVRVWRNWQAEADEIGLLEREEKRLRVKELVKIGLILGRLGGGIIVMGVNNEDPSQPLSSGLDKQCLRYLRVYSRHRVKLGPRVSDPTDDDFGEPESFILKAKDGDKEVTVHRDRVLVFKGQFAGHITSQAAATTGVDGFWGEAVVHAVNDAVMNATDAQDEIAGLISEAKIDVYGLPNLMNLVGDKAGERRVMRRLELANESKSIHRAMVKDAEETWEQRQINFGGMMDVIMGYVSLAAAAADIPATRLLSKSPDGMNATGDSDQENYDQMVQDIQSDSLAPALDKLDRVLIPSALGTRPEENEDGSTAEDIYYTFPPLHTPSNKDAAEIEAKEAETVSKLISTGLIPEEVMAESLANRLIESGRWPGLEDALKKLGADWFKTMLPDDPDVETDADGNPVPSDTPGTAPKPRKKPSVVTE